MVAALHILLSCYYRTSMNINDSIYKSLYHCTSMGIYDSIFQSLYYVVWQQLSILLSCYYCTSIDTYDSIYQSLNHCTPMDINDFIFQLLLLRCVVAAISILLLCSIIHSLYCIVWQQHYIVLIPTTLLINHSITLYGSSTIYPPIVLSLYILGYSHLYFSITLSCCIVLIPTTLFINHSITMYVATISILPLYYYCTSIDTYDSIDQSLYYDVSQPQYLSSYRTIIVHPWISTTLFINHFIVLYRIDSVLNVEQVWSAIL